MATATPSPFQDTRAVSKHELLQRAKTSTAWSPRAKAHLYRATDHGSQPLLSERHHQLGHGCYIDRADLVAELEVGAVHTETPNRFELSAGEFAALVSAAEPDAVVNVLARDNPDVLPLQNRARCYDQVAAACHFAAQHQVEAFPDIVAIATMKARRMKRELALYLTAAAMACATLSGCGEKMATPTIVGINYTDQHISGFLVNGNYAANVPPHNQGLRVYLLHWRTAQVACSHDRQGPVERGRTGSVQVA